MDYIALQDIADKLNGISWTILEILAEKNTLIYTELKDQLKISQEKVSKEIARLEGALLIESKRNEVDQRMMNFIITEYGHKILKLKK